MFEKKYAYLPEMFKIINYSLLNKVLLLIPGNEILYSRQKKIRYDDKVRLLES